MSDDWLVLNVGGERFEVTRTTLLKYHGSYFDALLNGSFKKAEGNEIKIDRDAQLFHIVLNFLRTGILQYSTELRAQVREEFRFYNLPYDICAENRQRVTLYGYLRASDGKLHWTPYDDSEIPEFTEMPLESDLCSQLILLLQNSDTVNFNKLLTLLGDYGFAVYHLCNEFYQERSYQKLCFEK